MHIPIEVASLYKVLPAQTIEISHNWTFASAQVYTVAYWASEMTCGMA